MAALIAEQTDLGLTLQGVSHPSLQCVALAKGQMQVLAPAGFWPEHEADLPLPLASLGGLLMIGLDDKDGLGGLLEGHLQTLATPVQISTRVQTYQLARHMVMAGQGVAIVDPFTGFVNADDALQARPLAPTLPVTLYGVTRQSQVLTEAQQALLSALQNEAQALLA